MKIDPDVHYILVGALSITFLIGALSKLQNQHAFTKAVRQYKMLPTFAVQAFALGIPLCEMILGVALLSESYQFVSSIGLLALTGIFLAGLTINMLRDNRAIDCGCYIFVDKSSRVKNEISWWHVTRVGFFICMIALTLVQNGARQITYLDYFTVLSGIIFLTFIYFTTNTLLAYLPSLSE